MTPTARSLALLRKQGYTIVDKVERREGPATHDLFGLWDILAIRGGEVLAVQTTSASNVAARIRKIESDELAPALAECRAAGWTLNVHGWDKPNPPKRRTYRLRLVDVS